MNKFTSILILSTLVSCVAPRDKRAMYDRDDESSSSSSSNNGSSISVDDSSSTSSGGTASSGANIPANISGCKWSLNGTSGFSVESHAHLGAHTICQSKTDQNEIYIQLKTPLPSTRVCVIPLNTSSGKSIFLGEAKCQFTDSSAKIYKFPLVKNRDYGKYQNFQVNSVMVMKEASYFFDTPFYRDQISYDAFFICSVNLDLHGDSSYCDAFKSKGEYVYKQF